ncbi:MAG: dienelactone hydrolase [Verrucomicrobiota bacterium]|nr:dienelactone hydrolase [Verrucomicrobiota bacterium]
MKTLLLIGILSAEALSPAKAAYDPLATGKTYTASMLDLVVQDAGRDRAIPVLVYLPESTNAAPVVLFSHGLGGSRHGNAYLGNHWAARGYVAVFVQHPGSDDSVWKGQKPGNGKKAMEQAATGNNYLLRVKDIPAVLDQLEQWNKTGSHVLKGRMDMERIGMSGHSFGAVTTQAVSGQTAGRITFTDPRIKAAIAFSPSSPRRGKTEETFGKVTIPWMLMTGTKDLSVIGNTDLASRLAVYPALPPGGKYELVLHNATHSAFGGRIPANGNPNHRCAILALGTAFWDAYLTSNNAAKEWLNGEGARSILEEQDRWKRK